MSDISADSFLEHYGVKGMKWGVRKKSTTSNKPKGSKKKFVRNVALGTLAGAAAGVVIGNALKKAGTSPSRDVLSGLPAFSASGPKGSISVGSAKEGMFMSVEMLNMLVKDL